MDPLKFLLERDPFRSELMRRISVRHVEMLRDLQTEQAHKIINALAEATKK